MKKRPTLDGVDLSDVPKVRQRLRELGFTAQLDRIRPLNEGSGITGIGPDANPHLIRLEYEKLDEGHQITHELSGCDGNLIKISGYYAPRLMRTVLKTVWMCRDCDTIHYGEEYGQPEPATTTPGGDAH